jgi:hypothetical protein
MKMAAAMLLAILQGLGAALVAICVIPFVFLMSIFMGFMRMFGLVDRKPRGRR